MRDTSGQQIVSEIKEELLERRDVCGIPDPTPYEAVRKIITQQRRENRKRDGWMYHRHRH